MPYTGTQHDCFASGEHIGRWQAVMKSNQPVTCRNLSVE
ncbi:hypothetical protein SAMN05444157_2196 [Frankineae bacterium MT45]|nr:hypothetical protein SAMN05444157_2196 [Frankineae bacterium MT45]